MVSVNAAHTDVGHAAGRRFSALKRGASMLGLVALLSTAVGCAVSQADTLSVAQHRTQGSPFGALAGVTTSELTSTYQSTTSARVVDSNAVATVDGRTAGELTKLASDAAWSVTLGEKIPGMRLGPFFGSDSVAPLQVGDIMLVSLRSSVLNNAGTAAFSMVDGSLLWQDRSLECQRVDLGGAVPCRQNSGFWAPFNPHAGAFGTAINPGFAPEAFGFADGVLYTARTNGAGMIEVAAGTVENPAEHWVISVPRANEAMIPGNGARIKVSDTIKVTIGAAEIELTKQGQSLAPEATLAQPESGAMVVDIEQTVGDTHIKNTVDDRVSTATWSIPSRVVSPHTITDGKNLTFVSGDDVDGTNLIRTISLADGHTVSEHHVVANAAQPRDIQSAAHGMFVYDKQFSTIAYYPAG